MATRKKSVYSLGGLLLLSLMLLLLAPGQGHAATFTVNSTADVVAANPAGGVCETAVGNGICTLRAAIQVANASVVADTIVLPVGTYTLTIAPLAADTTGLNGDLNINVAGGALTISGAGAATTIIDGGAIDRIFQTVGAGATASISGVTLRNGNVVGNGGAIDMGGATNLTLNNVVITGNTSSVEGGAINIGAGASVVTMNTVVITNNTSGAGGDIIANGAGAKLSILNGTISGNHEIAFSNKLGSSMTFTNVTISGNTSAGGVAAIDNLGTVNLQNVTVTLNTAAAGAGNGGIRNTGTLNLRNTIISGNNPVNCIPTVAFTSLGNNLDSVNTCGLLGAADLINTDPLLIGLANNGGAVQTHALTGAIPGVPGSPAIDAGSATGCPATDARGAGFLRPVDGNIIIPANTLDGVATCDIGAFEFRPQKIAVAPASINFGAVLSSTVHDQSITISNAGDAALTVGAVAVANPLAAPFSISINSCTLPVPRAGSCTIVARFAPTAVAAASDAFDIPSNDPATPTMAFALSGAASAVPVPGIAVTDSIAPDNDQKLPFGGVTIGLTSDATVTVTNTGTADLVINTIVAPAAPFSITADTCSGKTLTASATCALTIHFAPTANSVASSALAIPNNTAGTPSVAIALTGSGVSATGNNPPSAPVLLTPSDGQTGVPTTMTFVWNKSVDPDGDAVTYHFNNCTNQTMTAGCTPADVTAAAPSGLFFAGVGSFGAGIILIGFVAGSGLKRSRMTMFLIAFLLLSGTLIMSCHKSSSEEPTPTTQGTTAEQISNVVKNLTPNTIYYWKVVADDGKGGLSSSVISSYTTAP